MINKQKLYVILPAIAGVVVFLIATRMLTTTTFSMFNISMTFVQSTEETNQTLQDVGQFTNTTAETVQEDGASDVTKDTEHTTVK